MGGIFRRGEGVGIRDSSALNCKYVVGIVNRCAHTIRNSVGLGSEGLNLPRLLLRGAVGRRRIQTNDPTIIQSSLGSLGGRITILKNYKNYNDNRGESPILPLSPARGRVE